jgi:bifunctional UDP-N-acetylglucosamine pyrophosphorylase/glucosamine-1-phosphate N-acetyltransferase
MTDSIGIVILAAGKGTRLKLDIAKALCPIQGKSLIDFVLKELKLFVAEENLKAKMSVVVGHLKENVESHVKENFKDDVTFAWQKEQKGTADALKSYFDADETAWDHKYTLVVCADTPLLTSREFSKLYHEINANTEVQGVAATFKAEDPYGYGRILKGGNGFNIVEQKDASQAEQMINEVNSGLYIIKTEHIKKHLFEIDSKNKSNEFYLTDLFKQDFHVKACEFKDGAPFMGVNTLVQLEYAERELQRRKIESLQLSGVRFVNSSNCYIEEDVKVGQGTVVYPGVNLIGDTTVETDCLLESGVIVKDSHVHEGVKLLAYTYLENAEVGKSANIGPMARLRPGTIIGKDCKIGNFVETKKTQLHDGAKVSHLSYVGDAEIGENTNIGCGFITCNYDGANKHKTIIGKDSFIGSDCQMIAPVTLGEGVYVGSGSTINKDVPDGAFAIARERQTTKEGMAKRFLKTKKDT